MEVIVLTFVLFGVRFVAALAVASVVAGLYGKQ
jgi:hypothetical protein